MGVTRRYWGEAGLVVVLAGLVVLFDRPFLLVGMAGVAGWLVARQHAFVRAISGVASDISVTESPARNSARVDEEVQVTLGAELPRPSPIGIDLEANLPVGVEVSEATEESEPSEEHEESETTEHGHQVSLSVGEQSATTTFTVRCPLAGEFQFGRATLTAIDQTERFQTTFSAGSESRLTVNPRSPTNVHVGAGGEALKAPYGEHSSSDRGPGIDLAGIRAYVPGDEVKRIDWNATARLSQPHVREFETGTERQTVILIDCRPSMGGGSDGETKFDYARQVALSVVGHARKQGEPVSLYAVGQAGLLSNQPAAAIGESYELLEHRLRTLEPERTRENESGTSGGGTAMSAPVVARRRAYRLDDNSTFSTRLEPFFADADPYVERVSGNPLYSVARTYLERVHKPMTTVVLTDDTRPTETREVTKVARGYSDHVLVFLTPTALFESDPSDLEAAYDQYADFERFRRDLANVNRVSAFEVGPGDRLHALLTADEFQRRAGVGD